MDLCLADGIPKSERREIVTNEGSSPFRMNDLLSKRNDLFHPSIFGQVLKIILEEVMGIHTEVMRFEDFFPLPKHSSTYYQLTGCLPANIRLEPGGNLTTEEFCDPSIALHASLGPRLSTTRQEINGRSGSLWHARPTEWEVFTSIQATRLGGVIEDCEAFLLSSFKL